MNFPVKHEQGLTLIEIIASILLLSIIIISFLPLFVQSGKTIDKSEDVIEGTYLAQNLMEEIHGISNDNIGFKKWVETLPESEKGWKQIKPDQNCQKHFQKSINGIIANMYISKTVEKETTCIMPEEAVMKNVLITISAFEKPNIIESQMETILIWGN